MDLKQFIVIHFTLRVKAILRSSLHLRIPVFTNPSIPYYKYILHYTVGDKNILFKYIGSGVARNFGWRGLRSYITYKDNEKCT